MAESAEAGLAPRDAPPVVELAYACRHAADIGPRATAVDPAFDYHICFALRSTVAPKHELTHVRHKLNPQRFRSPSNDVSGIMGLLYELGDKDGDRRAASFERAIGDLVLFQAERVVRDLLAGGASTDGQITVLIRGPLFPKLRGRLLMSGISDRLLIYMVTADPKMLERMDLHANQAAVSVETLQRLPRNFVSEMIPPAGIDKGTRCWIVRERDRVLHYELVANMDRGIVTSEWRMLRRQSVKSLAAAHDLEALYDAAFSGISEFYAEQPPLRLTDQPTIRRPLKQPPARQGALPSLPARTGRPLTAPEVGEILQPYREFMGRDWPDFLKFVESEFCPEVNRIGREDDARAVLAEFILERNVDPEQNRLRLAVATDRLRDVVARLKGGLVADDDA